MNSLPDLYFVQNMMIFMEECFVSLPAGNDCFSVNPWYVQNYDVPELVREIHQLFPGLRYIPFEECAEQTWKTIYMSSYLARENIPKLTALNSSQTVLVEDGLFDYVPGAEKEYPFYYGKDLYLFRPELASEEAKKAILHRLEVSSAVINNFSQLYLEPLNKLRTVDPSVPVLFTTPLSEDFGAEETICEKILRFIIREEGCRRLVLKRHPRDHFSWKTNHLDLDIIECPQNIPGQFLDEIFTGKKIFLFPSTVSFMCGEMSDIIFLNVLPGEQKYREAFHRVVDSNIIKAKKTMQMKTITD